MELNFYDFQKKARGDRIMKHTVSSWAAQQIQKFLMTFMSCTIDNKKN